MGEMAIKWEGEVIVGVIVEEADWKLNVIAKVRQFLNNLI